MHRHKLHVMLGCALLLLIALAFTRVSSHQAFAASAEGGATQSAAGPDTSCPPEIGYGNTGQWVKTAQGSLDGQYENGNFTNYPYDFNPISRLEALKVDGIFGIDTENATKDFQYALHLSVDGVIGPHTWHALGWC